MVASTPATALRAPRMGEVLLSARGSPLVAGGDHVPPEGSATILRTRDGQVRLFMTTAMAGMMMEVVKVATLTDSPVDPFAMDMDIPLEGGDLDRIRNLRGKLSLLIRQNEARK